MALTRIDNEIVERLLTTQMATVNAAVVFVPRGRPAPSGTKPYAKIVGIDLDHMRRHKADGDADSANLVLAVCLFATPFAVKANAYVMSDALDRVATVLSEVTLRDAGTGHTVELDQASTAIDREPDEELGFVTGSVIVTGLVHRT